MNKLKVIAAPHIEDVLLRRLRGAPVSQTHAALIEDEYDRINFYKPHLFNVADVIAMRAEREKQTSDKLDSNVCTSPCCDILEKPQRDAFRLRPSGSREKIEADAISEKRDANKSGPSELCEIIQAYEPERDARKLRPSVPSFSKESTENLAKETRRAGSKLRPSVPVISQYGSQNSGKEIRSADSKIRGSARRDFLMDWLRLRAASLVVAVLFVLTLTWLYPQASLAQPVTYTQTDMNNTATGSFSYTAGSPPTYTISGAGTGFSYSPDSLSFVSTAATGNIEFETEVVSQGATGSTAQAGLMIRFDTWDQTSTSPMYAIAVTPGSGVNFYYRDLNTYVTTVSGPAIAAPVYLRLVKNGSVISGYYSTTGLGNWTLVGSHTVATTIPPLYCAGFFVDSSVSGTLNTSVFEDVCFMENVPQASANLLQWLRADAGVTSSSGSVSTWSDQSGNSNDATQSSGSLQPSVVAGAINSDVMPTVSFNGSSQYMNIASDFANMTAGATIVAVLEPGSSIATCTPCAYGNSSNSDAIFPQSVGTQAKLNVYDSSTSSSVTTTSNPLTTSDYHLLVETFVPGSSPSTGVGTIYVDGSQVAQSTSMVQTMNNTTRSSNVLGAGIGLNDYFQGGLAELLVFNTPLSSSQIAMLQSYIYSKYGVGTEPTLDAPTFSPGPGVFLPGPYPYTPGQSITPSQDQGAAIFYTVDGTTPSPSSSLFYNGTNSIFLDQTRTIKALAFAPFFNNSSVTSGLFQANNNTNAIPRNGLQLWLDANNSVTASGGNISAWGDISGQQNNATQSMSGDKPTLVSGAINGLPAVSFNGSSQFLQLPGGSTFSNFSSGASIFVVTNPASVTSGARFIDLGNGSASDNLLLDEPSSSGAALYVYTGSSPSNVTSSSAITTNQFQLLEAVYNGTTTATISTDGVEGAQSASMNTIANTNRANNYIGQGSGGGNYFEGQIAEMLVYNRAVTTSEQGSIEGYLLSKYQILPSQSTAAPTISVAGGTLTVPTQVAIEAPAAATIFYTLNGTSPTTSSTVYTGPINISYSQTLKAIAVINGISSTVSSASYTLDSTEYPAPNSGDTTPLQINTQLPVNGIPQDSNQH